MGDRTFLEAQDKLAERWGAMLIQAQTDEERGRITLDFILERERLRNGINNPGPLRDAIDRETLAKLGRPDGLGPEHSKLEVVFRRLFEDPASAFRYLEGAARQLSAAQSRRASKPRRRNRDIITKAIEEILEDSPEMTAKQVGKALEDRDDIYLIDDEYRHRADAVTLKVSNLASRVSDAKKRVSG